VGGYSDFSRVQTPLSSCAHSGASNKKRFFVDEKIHPQTKALIDTHAECVRFSVCSSLSAVYRTSLEPRSWGSPFGVKVVYGNFRDFDFSAKVRLPAMSVSFFSHQDLLNFSSLDL
jgi:hypothetical protein